VHSPVVTDDIKQSECLRCEGKKVLINKLFIDPLRRSEGKR